MKDLTPLEKEFFKILSGDSIPDEMPFTVNITKAVAALCERKIKRAIELARTGQMPIGWTYNEQEILELLNK